MAMAMATIHTSRLIGAWVGVAGVVDIMVAGAAAITVVGVVDIMAAGAAAEATEVVVVVVVSTAAVVIGKRGF